MAVNTHTMAELLKSTYDNVETDIYVSKMDLATVDVPLSYPFRSDHYAFVITENDELTFKINLVEYNLKPNSILVVHQDSIRQFVKFPKKCECTFVGFTKDFFLNSGFHLKNVELFEYLSGFGKPLIEITPNEMSTLQKILELLSIKISSKSEKRYQDDVVHSLFMTFIQEIGFLYGLYSLPELTKNNRAEEIAFSFVRLIPQHFRQNKKLKFYAELLNITPNHLSDTIRVVTGRSAQDFIHEVVEMEAKILLGNLTLTISQIATSLGFTDQYFFSKYFKKRCGLSPSEYRKKI